MGEEKRHEMMETLFGAESDESDDEPEPLRAALSDQASDRSDKEGSYEEGEGEDGDGDAEVEVEGEAESEGERGESDVERGASDEEERADSDRESEGGREVEIESEGEREEVEVSASGSERSHRAQPAEDYDDEEVQEEARGQSDGEEDEQQDDEPRERVEVAEARDVFGESDEEEDQDAEHEPGQETEGRRSPEESLQGSPERTRSDDEGSEGDAAQAEGIIGDEEDRDRSDRSESDDERHIEHKPEKPMGPPIELQVPLRPPPGAPDQLNIVRMSNIMNIDMKPFDPTTYEAEEPFTTEVEGKKQHLRLEENVVRWRPVHNRDGDTSYESNARFVKWSDGSMQLLLGSEVLDLSVQNAAQDQSHLFVRHHKSILQSQGQVLRKMRFMPSSLTSKSHRLLTALVDSKHKKVFKVKAVITETDPEKMKHDIEKQVQERIRSRVDLQRKQEKLSSKYHAPRPRVTERERELSPGYLEGALEEEDEIDPYDRRTRRYQEQLEQEQRAERRIMHAKRQAPARPPLSRSMNKRRPPKDDFLDDSMSDDSDREPSAQESDHNDDLVGGAWEEEDDDDEEEERRPPSRGKAVERDDRRRGDREEDDRKRKREREERSPSPAKKPISRRRVVVSDSDDD